MKVLIVTPEVPYPPDQGGRIRMFNIIKHLSRKNTLYLVSTSISPTSLRYYEKLMEYCKSVYIVPHYNSPLNRASRIVKSILTRRPFVVYKHMSKALENKVAAVVAKEQPDVVLVEFHYIADCVRAINLPRVVDMHNIDHVLYKRLASNPRFSLKKVHAWVQAPLMRKFETIVPQQFDACVVVSREDASRLEDLSGTANTVIIPNGVDVDYFSPYVNLPEIKHSLVYVGSMDYYPNIDAVLWLYREIMPLIWQKRPRTTLAIVGRNPPKSVQALQADSRIYVSGAVEDVRPYWKGASIAILPIRVGSGTKLKVLEAASMGKAIVGTPIAFEGFDFQHGTHVIVGNNAYEISASVIELLDDDARREKLGYAARQLAYERYKWSYCIDQLEEVLESICQKGKYE